MEKTVDDPKLPTSSVRLSRHLRELHQRRKTRHRENRERRRGQLTSEKRTTILKSTGGRCHICGGRIRGTWQADHVLCCSGGGADSPENFLPAHPLCNNYRWDYSPEEFQWILKLGVWARTQIEQETSLGNEIAEKFHEYEQRRRARKRARPHDP